LRFGFNPARRGTTNDITSRGSDANPPRTTLGEFFADLADGRRRTLHNIGQPAINQRGNNLDGASDSISITSAERSRLQAFWEDDEPVQQDFGDEHSSAGEDDGW
jgi:hypothetical protein